MTKPNAYDQLSCRQGANQSPGTLWFLVVESAFLGPKNLHTPSKTSFGPWKEIFWLWCQDRMGSDEWKTRISLIVWSVPFQTVGLDRIVILRKQVNMRPHSKIFRVGLVLVPMVLYKINRLSCSFCRLVQWMGRSVLARMRVTWWLSYWNALNTSIRLKLRLSWIFNPLKIEFLNFECLPNEISCQSLMHYC